MQMYWAFYISSNKNKFTYLSIMFEIHIIESGYIFADGGAMFGAIPKRAWSRKYGVDADNRCRLAMRCVLAVSDDRKILIDLGMGDKNNEIFAYYEPHELKNIENEINKLGYNASDITDVILTHLHFDHCGYSTRKDKDGRIMPSFPNARYWLSRKQWMNLLRPNLLEADSLIADNILPVYDAGQLNMIDEDIELCDTMHLKLFDGHTEGQLVAYIKTNNGLFVFPGDVVPTASHAALEWISAYDINALSSLNEKKRLLEEVVNNDYTLIYCHDEKVQMSKVKRLNDNYKAEL